MAFPTYGCAKCKCRAVQRVGGWRACWLPRSWSLHHGERCDLATRSVALPYSFSASPAKFPLLSLGNVLHTGLGERHSLCGGGPKRSLCMLAHTLFPYQESCPILPPSMQPCHPQSLGSKPLWSWVWKASILIWGHAAALLFPSLYIAVDSVGGHLCYYLCAFWENLTMSTWKTRAPGISNGRQAIRNHCEGGTSGWNSSLLENWVF